MYKKLLIKCRSKIRKINIRSRCNKTFTIYIYNFKQQLITYVRINRIGLPHTKLRIVFAPFLANALRKHQKNQAQIEMRKTTSNILADSTIKSQIHFLRETKNKQWKRYFVKENSHFWNSKNLKKYVHTHTSRENEISIQNKIL